MRNSCELKSIPGRICSTNETSLLDLGQQSSRSSPSLPDSDQLSPAPGVSRLVLGALHPSVNAAFSQFYSMLGVSSNSLGISSNLMLVIWVMICDQTMSAKRGSNRPPDWTQITVPIICFHAILPPLMCVLKQTIRSAHAVAGAKCAALSNIEVHWWDSNIETRCIACTYRLVSCMP